jgi:hypothetical protein
VRVVILCGGFLFEIFVKRRVGVVSVRQALRPGAAQVLLAKPFAAAVQILGGAPHIGDTPPGLLLLELSNAIAQLLEYLNVVIGHLFSRISGPRWARIVRERWR